MLIVFRIMPSVEGPETPAQNPMNVLGFLDIPILAHDQHLRFYQTVFEEAQLLGYTEEQIKTLSPKQSIMLTFDITKKRMK